MRVLMFGWEFPPHVSGGLGTACYGMTRALASRGTDILFVLPCLASTESSGQAHKMGEPPASGTPKSPARGNMAVQGVGSVSSTIPGTPSEETVAHTAQRVQLLSAADVFASGAGSARATATSHQVHQELNPEEHLRLHPVDSTLFAYATPQSYQQRLLPDGTVAPEAFQDGDETVWKNASGTRNVSGTTWQDVAPSGTPASGGSAEGPPMTLKGGYGPDLMTEVYRFGEAAGAIALREDFDVIHVHDWMTYPAGMAAQRLTGKPLVAHIHATEYDRSGDKNINYVVARIEQAGMMAADRVVAVSQYTRDLIMRRYGIPGDKISVVHNAVARSEAPAAYHVPDAFQDEKRVLFMGRVTYQKGPEYFVEAAHLVLQRMPGVRFVMAGSGDMLSRMVRRVAQLRMGSRFHFTGFLKGGMVDQMYATSDLYVMPSVSEPFGIAPLEAMIYDTPVLLSRQSGVAEVVTNALKVDFWDIREMANKICAVLAYPRLASAVVANCREDLKNIKWENAADLLNDIYRNVCIRRG